MAKVTINGVAVEVPDGTNVVRAAEMAGQEIPHYCYHPGLSVAGNCRMCLIDIKAMSAKQPNPLPKLQIGCNTIVADGMVVETNNPRVEEARRGVLEFLLINHPIDCPICDQAGECKLQEYYMDYGRYDSRMLLEEKQRKGKAMPVGPDIMLDQERCILCTRCIRFLDEVTQTHELCMKERGDHSELSVAEGRAVDNDYSVNVVDICPVGALTSREFRFQARVWYLDRTDSICPGCANGCNIEVHSREGRIYRLKPRANEQVNGYWMCDEGRRTWHGVHTGDRLTASYVRSGDEFVEVDAREAAASAAGALVECSRVAIVASASLSMEEGFLLRAIAQRLGGAPCIIVSPALSSIPDDGFLISTDRYPNRAGLLALGFVEAAVPAATDGVILAREDAVASDEKTWGALLEQLHEVLVIDEHVGKSMAYANQVLAVATHFEAPGSFVNRRQRLQAFAGAVPPPGRCVAGWEALANLLAELGGPRYGNVQEIFAATCLDLGLSTLQRHEDLGRSGALLDELRRPTDSAAAASVAAPAPA
ncbi:MAG TPA: 2Fe-2S iron-sulfur cluster-binding protein [Candidatus Binatia bacterium]|nr:2Fe-2S iron-sulfur cluster-binding protein [Candidatus Binatia bacterium]